MSDINHSAAAIRRMDELEKEESFVHGLNPAVKLIVTITYIFLTASYDKYDLWGLFPMILYPAAMFSISGISAKECFYKLRFVMPVVLLVGVFNPFYDRQAALTIGSVTVSGGVLSMVTLMLKGIFCLAASYILAATTTMDSICRALRKFHVPSLLVNLLLLTYRYIYVLIDEASVMMTAYKLRAPSQKGVHYSAWGSFLGQLLLRSMDRAEELYSSMLLRGFTGDFEYSYSRRAQLKDYAFMAVSLAMIVTFRFVCISKLLGGLFV